MKVSKNVPPECLRMTWSGQFNPIFNFSNLFPPKWLRITWNGQFCLIHNFSNLFPPKWLRMTQNGQLCMAKKKKTMIQGNFYERLHFYMDSCAISPMASLFRLEVLIAHFSNLGPSRTTRPHYIILQCLLLIHWRI